MNDGPLATPDPKTLRPPAGGRLRRLSQWLLFAVIAVIGAEIGARVEDRVFGHIGFFEESSEDSLWTRTNGIRHGVPYARFKNVRFNNVGLDGPDIAVHPPADCQRFLFLGSSETFGEPSSYVSHLAAGNHTQACGEFLNAAIPGMTVASMKSYYRDHLAKFDADVVFIYPATHFYLSSDPPKLPPKAVAPAAPDLHARVVSTLDILRLVDRLRDAIRVPETIQLKRRDRWIAEQIQGKPADWLFSEVPEERLELLVEDIAELVGLIRESGATPVLFTQGVRVTATPEPDDLSFLHSMRVWVPRATEEALAAFPYAANERIRAYAANAGVELIDVASELSGRREMFVDMVHYAPDGHRQVAELVARFLAEHGER